MKKECKFAIFNYQSSDADLVDELAKYLDDHAQIAFDFFKVDVPKEKIEIHIVPTKQEYDKKYIQDRNLPQTTTLHGWMIGNYLFEKNEITYLSLHDFKNTNHKNKDLPYPEALAYYRKTILHEFVHYVNGLFRLKHNCGDSEKYLTEGIATYLSGQNEGKDILFDFSLQDLLNRDKNIYDAYYLITKYFVEHYDKDYVLQVFQSNRQARELLTNELFDKAKEHYSKSNPKTKTL